MATKYVSDTKAAKSISAYIITDKKGRFVAKVQVHYADGGRITVNVFDTEAGFQSASAGGGGYDKFAAALSGMTIAGHKMSNHCGTEGVPKTPKGRKTYPKDYKVKPGYSLANWTSISKKTGNRVDSYDFRNKAQELLGEDAEWEAVKEKAFQMDTEWRASDDCESGYGSCFRLTGLDYLKALGFNVFQAI